MARISLQPLSNEYPPGIGADDWSHYAPLVGIVPYVDSILADSAWFTKYDYKSFGITMFKTIYKGRENTYAWLLYEIDKRYGKEIIGNAIKDVIECRYWRHPDIVEFMSVLGKKTEDKDIIEKIKKAYPTPFEHSLLRWKRWKKFGFEPPLQDMFIENKFTIDGIVSGSVADSAGFKKNDIIVKIDGFNQREQKADCYRNLLRKDVGDKIIFTIKKDSKTKQLEILIK